MEKDRVYLWQYLWKALGGEGFHIPVHTEYIFWAL